ncbi:hypothetical protein D3C72_1280230 [compost metagenome]
MQEVHNVHRRRGTQWVGSLTCLGVVVHQFLYSRRRIWVSRVESNVEPSVWYRVLDSRHGVGQHHHYTQRSQDLVVLQQRLTDTEAVVVECEVRHQLSRYEQQLCSHVRKGTCQHDPVHFQRTRDLDVVSVDTVTQTSHQVFFHELCVDPSSFLSVHVRTLLVTFYSPLTLGDQLRRHVLVSGHVHVQVVVVLRPVCLHHWVTSLVKDHEVTNVFVRRTWNVHRDDGFRRQTHYQRVTHGSTLDLVFGLHRHNRTSSIQTRTVERHFDVITRHLVVRLHPEATRLERVSQMATTL